MRFFDPSNVYLEKNCVKNHAKELLALGTKAFIITGAHSAKLNGSLDDVISVLDSGNIPYVIFSDVEENPSVETVVKASRIGIEENVDFVIGIGGGSPIDAAKAIALLVANKEETSDCLYVAKDLKPLPICAVPTTCGTGSEATPVAVLTRHEFQTKKSISYQLFPDLALVDGTYLSFAKKSLLVNTAIDALAHCIESFLHATSTPMNRMFSEYGLKMWAKSKDFLLGNGELTDEIAENLMLASTIAGMAIAHTGTSLPHVLSYELTYCHGVPHGKACGLFLSSYIKKYASHNQEDVDTLLSLLELDSIDAFSSMIRELLGEESITEKECDIFVEKIMRNTAKLATYPYALNESDIHDLFTESLTISVGIA